MKISTRSQYGLRAIVYLAKSKRICPLKEISKKEDISFDYLEKIFSKLGKAGLIGAKKGLKGGYFLISQPKKIKVGEILKILEGEMALVKCIAKNGKYICPRERKCETKKLWQKIQNSLNLTLESITLADLLKKNYGKNFT